MNALEIHTVKGGKLEKVRFVQHQFEDGTTAQFRVDKDRSVHEVKSSNRKASMNSRAYKSQLCPFSVDTDELDYKMLDDWVRENSCGLWFRGGFKTYNFQQDADAVFFKLTWGGEEADDNS